MKRFFTNWWFVSAVVALLVLLVLIVGLPIFVGFMRPWWVRLIVAVLVIGVWGLLAFLRARAAKKGADAIAAELAAPSAADQESQQLAQRMTEALGQLKTAAGKKNRDYLYSRPWYIIIGPPGAGKTTALVHSGLRFPFENQAFRGVGGTRNLDFMFADEAVLVDTAGRYTSQDSDASVDGKAWNSFLGLLKRNRPLQPINGVIVAIGVDELIRGDRQSIDNHAAAVRRRLAELRRALEIKVPVYVLLTKADLLAGFVEYHDDLDVEGRRAVLGHTLALNQAKPSAEQLTTAFDALAREVSARQAKRLAEEPDAQRRALLLGFPSQLASLRTRLMRFLDGAFVAGDEPAGVLRGFYLTSGVQEGAPLDRIISGMADVYDAPRSTAQGSGRAYFLNRLLGEVMFPEAGLVQMDPAARKRQKGVLVGAIAGIAALSLLTLVAWGVSFAKNCSFQNETLAKATATRALVKDSGIDLVEVRDSDATLEQSLDALIALRTLPRGYQERQAGGAPLSMRFGLFQRSLSQQNEEAYREGLRRILLPRILLQLEQHMAQNLANPLAIYEPLKVYLMLGGLGPMDAKAVRRWVEANWANEAYPGGDAAEMRTALSRHLKSLLEDDNLAAAWPQRKAPLDGQLIASARAAVQQMSMAERAYAILRQKALAGGGDDWQAGTAIGSGQAQAFANPDQVLSLTVPFLFTQKGFNTAYQAGLGTVQNDLKADLWVLGGDANTTGVREQISGVRGGVANLYARDYIAAWEGVIATAKPADYFNNAPARAAFTAAPSPLKLLLLEVRKNTIFKGGATAARDMISQRVTSRLGQAAQLVPGAQGLDAASAITAHFKPIHDYVGDGKAPGPIDEFVGAVRSAGLALEQAKLAGGGLGAEAAQAATAQAIAQVNAAAAGAPPQMQPFVADLAKGGGQAQVGAATGAVADAYVQTVLPACRAVSQDRYPFFQASANDLSTVDAGRVFGLAGVVDSFVTQRLMPLMDITGPIWRWKEGDPVASTLDPATPDAFAKAAEVRDLLSGGLTLRIEPITYAGGVDAVQFQSGDTTYRFDATNKAPKQIRWSAQGGLPEASVVLYKGTTEVARMSEEGVWALFRLIDKAKRENAGPTAFLATFGQAPATATLRVILPDERNPFSRGGMWTFRCPVTL
ncbi:type VI secretion system membrane subunit TssM [Sphingomonas sp. 1P06PA]|uniref:type VI secretion system membrane subunit TssM n=1 Tax=Sphingomonas sp. 1P06PA TaxID=554121 RepID=UPI0039A66153